MTYKKKPRVATEAFTQNKSHSNFNVFGPVDKLKFLSIAVLDIDLSRCDLAILFVIANGANSKTGLTWRSFNTMARETASTSRTAKRSVKKLLEKKYIAIAKKGGWGCKANTYALGGIDLLKSGDTSVTKGIDSPVTPMVNSGDLDGTLEVTSMPSLSMTVSEPKARIEGYRSSDCDAVPYGEAVASSGTHHGVGDRYPEFWSAFPLRAGVAFAENILSGLIKAGVSYEEIISGARRYAEYCKTSRKRVSADAWLERESWRDDWTVRITKKAKEHKAYRGIYKGVDATLNEKELEAEYKYWEDKDQKGMNDQSLHEEKCLRCRRYWEDDGDGFGGKSDNGLSLCAIGWPIQKAILYSSARLLELEHMDLIQ